MRIDDVIEMYTHAPRNIIKDINRSGKALNKHLLVSKKHLGEDNSWQEKMIRQRVQKMKNGF